MSQKQSSMLSFNSPPKMLLTSVQSVWHPEKDRITQQCGGIVSNRVAVNKNIIPYGIQYVIS
jgi:hypothetical protein